MIRGTASATAPDQGLQIQLVIALNRYEEHLRPLDCLRNRLGINVAALVRLYISLTYCAGISRTSRPCSSRALPLESGPPQASMPINLACRFAVKCSSCLRENFLRTTTSPHGGNWGPFRGSNTRPGPRKSSTCRRPHHGC